MPFVRLKFGVHQRARVHQASEDRSGAGVVDQGWIAVRRKGEWDKIDSRQGPFLEHGSQYHGFEVLRVIQKFGNLVLGLGKETIARSGRAILKQLEEEAAEAVGDVAIAVPLEGGQPVSARPHYHVGAGIDSRPGKLLHSGRHFASRLHGIRICRVKVQGHDDDVVLAAGTFDQSLHLDDVLVRGKGLGTIRTGAHPDAVEPDGLPNARNVPTSTSHSNIWYHLGLAHFLRGDFLQAERCYRTCLEFSKNPDMESATRHWLYMSLRRQGKEEEAKRELTPITDGMDIIENHGYHQLLLMYKGLRRAEDLIEKSLVGDGIASATVAYGAANWFFYNGDRDRAREIFLQIVSGEQWSAFGHIAAEADLARMTSSR